MVFKVNLDDPFCMIVCDVVFSNCTGRTANHRRRVQDKHSRKRTAAFEDRLPQGIT
jgi:hypothetical protein